MTVPSIDETIYEIVKAGLAGLATVGSTRPESGGLPFVKYSLADRDDDLELDGPSGAATATFEFEISSLKSLDRAAIGDKLFDVLCPISGNYDGREVFSILPVAGESDGDDRPDDGSQTVIYTRTKRYDVLYLR